MKRVHRCMLVFFLPSLLSGSLRVSFAVSLARIGDWLREEESAQRGERCSIYSLLSFQRFDTK